MTAPRTLEIMCCEADGCDYTDVSVTNGRAWCGHVGTGRKIRYINAEQLEQDIRALNDTSGEDRVFEERLDKARKRNEAALKILAQ